MSKKLWPIGNPLTDAKWCLYVSVDGDIIASEVT